MNSSFDVLRRISLAALCAVGFLGAVSAQAQDDASVYVAHGIPGTDLGLDPDLPVDVSVDGACALPGFLYKDVVGPLALPAGDYDIAISLANVATPCSEAPVIAATVPFEAGESATVIAHLTDAGGITASKFVNDLSESGKARLVVRHTAFAPAVDIKAWRRGSRFFDRIKIEDLSNPNAAQADLRPGTWGAKIFPAGSRDAVAGPVDLPLTEGRSLVVFAVGSLANATFDFIVQDLELDSPTEALVSVIHGINGSDLGLDELLPVDVSVNGACALPGFVFGEIAGPLPLEAGAYDLAISLANEGAPCSNDPVIEAAGVEFDGGVNYSVIAHLAEDGSPTASVFVNDNKARSFFWISPVTVRHTAAAPTVDVIFKRRWWGNFSRKIRNLANGEEGAKRLVIGPYDARVNLAGTDTTALGPLEVFFDPQTAYYIYAVGSAANGSLTVIVQTAPLEY